jgi:hypothetical protein
VDAGDVSAAGGDAAATPDEGAPPVTDSGTVVDVITVCVPGDVSGYVPSWHPPSPPQSACTQTELDDLVTNCFGPVATQQDCDAFRAASPGCWACMVTPDTSATWGPIVASSLTPFTYGNFAGCLAIQTGDSSSTSCGAQQQAARVCTEYACSGTQCPRNSMLDIDAIAQCVSDALGTVCASYQTKELACVEGLQSEGGSNAAAVHVCSESTYGDIPGYYRAIGAVFCLGQSGDAASAGD